MYLIQPIFILSAIIVSCRMTSGLGGLKQYIAVESSGILGQTVPHLKGIVHKSTILTAYTPPPPPLYVL